MRLRREGDAIGKAVQTAKTMAFFWETKASKPEAS